MNLVLSSEIVLALEVSGGSEEHAGAAVLEQHWLASFHDLTLHLETAVRICVVQDPGRVSVRSAGVHEGDLVA